MSNFEHDVVSSPLLPLIKLVAQSQSVAELRGAFLDAARPYFGATRGALMLLSDMPKSNLPLGVQENPVTKYLFTRHAPVHEGIVASPQEWQAQQMRHDHGHVLTGPVVSQGKIVGVLAFTRKADDAPFNADDLADVSALCLHISALFARENTMPDATLWQQLSPREKQICQLVGEGLTNAQIGARLHVSPETIKANLKRIFRKTDVKSRAQLSRLIR